MTPAGRLIHDVTLLAPSSIIDANGDATTSYRPVYVVPAAVRYDTSVESVVNGSTVARVTQTITIRYVEDVDDNWQVLLTNGRTLSILSATPVGDHQLPDDLEIVAVEVRS